MTLLGETRQHQPRTRLRFVDEYAALEDLHGPHPSPTGEIRISVVAKIDDGAQVPFEPPRELVMTRTSMGNFVWFGRHRLPDQKPQVLNLEEGVRYLLRVEHDQAVYGPIQFHCIGPDLQPDLDPDPDELQFDSQSDSDDPQAHGEATPHDSPLRLRPGSAFRFEGVDPLPNPANARPGRGPTLLRGGVFHPDGRGMEGVKVSTRVSVGGQSRTVRYPLTDSSGAWVLAISGRFSKPVQPSKVTLQFELPSGETIDVDGVAVVTGRQTSHTQTALQGRVLDPRGIGKRGVVIRSSSDPDLQSLTDRNGAWSLYFPLDRHTATAVDTTLTFVAADGQTLTHDIQIQPGQVVVVEDIHF